MMSFQRCGFTLIELLVVMAIISIAATLVGPLAVNQYERSKQTAEREALLRLLNNYTFSAYSNNQAFTLITEGDQLTLYRGLAGPRPSWQRFQGTEVEVAEFEYLSFPQQELRLNRHGFWEPSVIEWLEGERELTTELNMTLVESGESNAPRD